MKELTIRKYIAIALFIVAFLAMVIATIACSVRYYNLKEYVDKQEENDYYDEFVDLLIEYEQLNAEINFLKEHVDYETEIAKLQAELKYLKEHIDLIVDNEVAQEEQYMLEQYLDAFMELLSNANKELVTYGLYLDYDGKIYKMEE